MKRWFLKNEIWLFLAPVLCLGTAGLLGRTGWGERFEWRTLDWRTQVRAELGQAGPDSRILIIGIGDRSTINIEPWPFLRAYHAQLQQLVAFNQPAVLTWDIIFQNRVDRDGVPWDGDSDSDFSTTTSALVEQGVPIVFAAVSAADPTGDDANLLGITWPIDQIEGDWENLAGDEFLTLPFPGIRGNGYFGTVDAPRGAGGIVRHMPMLVRVGERVFPSLTLQSWVVLCIFAANKMRRSGRNAVMDETAVCYAISVSKIETPSARHALPGPAVAYAVEASPGFYLRSLQKRALLGGGVGGFGFPVVVAREVARRFGDFAGHRCFAVGDDAIGHALHL